MLLSGFLAVLLAGLGMFVRSEAAHDAFHAKNESLSPHHHEHGHPHDHHRHEHTSPLIDLLAEEQLLSGSYLVGATHELSLKECRLPARVPLLALTAAVSQPPGRAPPVRVFS